MCCMDCEECLNFARQPHHFIYVYIYVIASLLTTNPISSSARQNLPSLLLEKFKKLKWTKPNREESFSLKTQKTLPSSSSSHSWTKRNGDLNSDPVFITASRDTMMIRAKNPPFPLPSSHNPAPFNSILLTKQLLYATFKNRFFFSLHFRVPSVGIDLKWKTHIGADAHRWCKIIWWLKLSGGLGVRVLRATVHVFKVCVSWPASLQGGIWSKQTRQQITARQRFYLIISPISVCVRAVICSRFL